MGEGGMEAIEWGERGSKSQREKSGGEAWSKGTTEQCSENGQRDGQNIQIHIIHRVFLYIHI